MTSRAHTRTHFICCMLMIGASYFFTMPVYAGFLESLGASSAGGSCTISKSGSASPFESCVENHPATIKTEESQLLGAGNPIHIATGNKHQIEVDMPALPGVLGLEVVRHYDSDLATRSKEGLWGRGWRLSYETRLKVGVQKQEIYIEQSDGSSILFRCELGQGQTEQCQARMPELGLVERRPLPQGDVFIWKWRDGRELMFNRHGALTVIRAATGEAVHLFYHADGALDKVIDAQNRELKMLYMQVLPSVRGRQVRAIKTPLGEISYDYEALNGTVESDGKRLIKRTYASDAKEGWSRIYHYEDKRFPELLTGISVEQKTFQATTRIRIATWNYDEWRRATFSVKGGAHQRNERIELDFSKPFMTRLKNSLGQITEYRYVMLDGRYRLLESRGAGCASCAPANQRYEYDQEGRWLRKINLSVDGTSIDSIRVQRDAEGRVTDEWHGIWQNDGRFRERWMKNQEYESTVPYPTKVSFPSVVEGKKHILMYRYNKYGQVVSIREQGWSPDRVEPLERRLDYSYADVAGHSVLIKVHTPYGEQQWHWDKTGTRIVEGRIFNDIYLKGVMRWNYDALGRVIEVETESEGTQETPKEKQKRLIRYNAQGQIERIQEGQQTYTMRYGWHGYPIETRLNGQLQARYDYVPGETGQRLRTAWDAQGVIYHYRYDSEGHLTAWHHVTPQQHFFERYRYNQYGQLEEKIDQNGYKEQMHYDAWGRMASHTDGWGRHTTFAYDSDNHLLSYSWLEREHQSVAVRLAYDPLGRLMRLTSPEGVESQSQRDDFGRLIMQGSSQKGLRRYKYDAYDRLIESNDSLGRQQKYQYLPSGESVKPLESSKIQNELYTYQTLPEGHKIPNYRHIKFNDVAGKLAFSVSYGYEYKTDSYGVPRMYQVRWPDGSLIESVRNQSGEVTQLIRHRLQTPWLRRWLPSQVILKNIQRDAVDISAYKQGNRIQAQYNRSWNGVLQSIRYEPAAMPSSASSISLVSHHYDWALGRQLIRDTSPQQVSGYLYDAQQRLLASQRLPINALPQRSHDYYLYDTAGNRDLSQESIRGEQVPHEPQKLSYDAMGQAIQDDNYRYVWDKDGRLSTVYSRGKNGSVGKEVASYAYNTNDERIRKIVNGRTHFYVYESGQRVAELDEQGRLQRHLFYIGHRPVAMVEWSQPRAVKEPSSSSWSAFCQDIAVLWRHWRGQDSEALYFIQTNHLGAPEQVTDSDAKVIWQATYQNFGAADVSSSSEWRFDLRLPGQWFDAETGLHYNHHRYYDPKEGRYLTPDPLGVRAGLNLYAYANNNPLRFIDPTGLILFAFDGTGNNSSSGSKKADYTNVWWMYQYYDKAAEGQKEKSYQRGIGTDPSYLELINKYQRGLATNPRDFVDRQLDVFNTYAMSKEAPKDIVIDLVGFSRGAALARVFANELIKNYENKKYGSHCLIFRFMGLFDTVSQFGANGFSDDKFNFNIGYQWKHVAQAYALNEHRLLFPFRSIAGSSVSYIEQGFVGAHADIGGGYNTSSEPYPGDLSDVALNWMINQAKRVGVKFTELPKERREVTAPIVHDERNAELYYGARGEHVYTNPETHESTQLEPEERMVILPNGKRVTQTNFGIKDAQYGALLEGLIQRPKNWETKTDNCAGVVNMVAYQEWLKKNHILENGILFSSNQQKLCGE